VCRKLKELGFQFRSGKAHDTSLLFFKSQSTITYKKDAF
jgi:hypothetical protein